MVSLSNHPLPGRPAVRNKASMRVQLFSSRSDETGQAEGRGRYRTAESWRDRVSGESLHSFHAGSAQGTRGRI